MKPQTSEQQLLWQKVMKHETADLRAAAAVAESDEA
jgi:hypothetical protein